MLQNPTKGDFPVKPYQYVLFNNMAKRNRFYENATGIKNRTERRTPSMQQVIRADMERMKTNQIYDRRLNRDLNGPKGLTWQCRQELQRLRSDERGVERDLLRLNRDLAKVSSIRAVSRSPSLARSQTSRLAAIAEEHSSSPIMNKPKITVGRSVSMSSTRAAVKHLPAIKKQSFNEPFQSLSKNSFQQLIAKTSDDHLHHQQKRIVEQKLKQFLH